MIIKILSANDLGITNSHQAGMHVPKEENILSYFPALDKTVKNPRTIITFTDDAGDKWRFTFIYYNNRFFGGTRNEYRLTCTTSYFKAKNLKEGDQVNFSKENGQYFIFHKRLENIPANDYIKLGNSWITINL